MLFWRNESITFWTIEGQPHTFLQLSSDVEFVKPEPNTQGKRKKFCLKLFRRQIMWGVRIPWSLWPEIYHFWLSEMIQRSPYRLKRRARQKRSTSLRACQHDSHDTGIWISSCTVISEILEPDKIFPRKFKRTTRYSKGPFSTAVNGKETGRMKLQMEVETPLILVSGLWKSGNSWGEWIEENQSLTNSLKYLFLFSTTEEENYFSDMRSISQTCQQRTKQKNKKSKSQVEFFGTKAENILAGQINWRICAWKEVMVAKITG